MTEAGITLYGIPNCDQVKKARTWLDAHQRVFAFHDVKKGGLARSVIDGWLQHLTWDQLINRKGTTWRALPEQRKALIVDAESAIALMLDNASIIKRPVLATHSRIVVGFSDDLYQQIFAE